MNTKLTLRMDDSVIRMAKAYSERTGKSVSRLVEDYLTVLGGEVANSETELTPRVRRMYGALVGADVSEADYRVYLEAKHR